MLPCLSSMSCSVGQRAGSGAVSSPKMQWGCCVRSCGSVCNKPPLHGVYGWFTSERWAALAEANTDVKGMPAMERMATSVSGRSSHNGGNMRCTTRRACHRWQTRGLWRPRSDAVAPVTQTKPSQPRAHFRAAVLCRRQQSEHVDLERTFHPTCRIHA